MNIPENYTKITFGELKIGDRFNLLLQLKNPEVYDRIKISEREAEYADGESMTNYDDDYTATEIVYVKKEKV